MSRLDETRLDEARPRPPPPGTAAAVPASATISPPRIAFTAGLATSHPDVVTTAADGTRIAFDSHRDSNVSTEIYVMNADGGDQRRLTHISGHNGIFSSCRCGRRGVT